MKTYLVDFATKEFYPSQRLLNKSALTFGLDEIISYTQQDIKKTDFYAVHRSILDQKRGAGYWLWKPYIILKTLEAVNDGDIIVYADSGLEIRADLEPLFELVRGKTDILTFSTRGYSIYLNKYLTKRDCFILMDCDSEKYWDAEMRDAGFHLYRKTAHSVAFVRKWLTYAENENILTDKENTQGHNLDGFIDHRHDQSIFSLLAEKEGLEKFRDPSQWGNYLKLPEYRKAGEFLSKPYSVSPYVNSPYGTLVDRHRRKQVSLFGRLLMRTERLARSYLPKTVTDTLLPARETRPKIKVTYET